MQNHLYCRSQ